MKAELVPENGDPPIPITRDLVVLGRRSYCDIVIDHASLSKRHCVLVKTDGLLIIRDLISTNGTKVKGQKIRWAALLPDDRISVGSYKLRVYYGPDDVPGPSELYRTRAQRTGAGARQLGSRAAPRAAHAGIVPSTGFAGGPVFNDRGARAGSDRGVSRAFAPGGPRSSLRSTTLRAAPSGKGHDPEPLLPIVLDDSDEIIDLD